MKYLHWISLAVLLATLQGSVSQQTKSVPTGEDLCKHSFHAYLCNNPPKTGGRRRVYNGQPQGASQPPQQNQLTGANSFPQGTRLLPEKQRVQPNLIPDTSNVFQAEAYLPPVGSKPPADRYFIGDQSNRQSSLLLPPTDPPKPRPTTRPPPPTQYTTRSPPLPPRPQPTTRVPPPPPPPITRPPPTQYTTRPPPPSPQPTRRPPPPTPPPTTRPPPPRTQPTTRPPPPRTQPTTRPPPPRTQPTTRPPPPRPQPTTRPPPPLRFEANQDSGVKVLPEKKKHDGCGHSFHSFLCDSKKSGGRRRTYTGQRPANIPDPANFIGASSFVQTEKVSPPQQPNAISQGSALLGESIYLPPAKTSPPPRKPPTPTLPPPTQAPYRPPVQTQAPYRPPPTPPPTLAPYRPPQNTPPPYKPPPFSPRPAPQQVQPTYLPPRPQPKPRPDPDIQPAAAQSPDVRVAPNLAEKSEGCKHAFHSYLCDPPKSKGQRRIYNGQRPGALPPNQNVIGQNSFPQPAKVLPPQQKPTRPPPTTPKPTPPPPPPPTSRPFQDGSLLLSSNLNPNTYLPPVTQKPKPTPTYLPPKPPQNNNLFGENSFLDPSRLPPPTEKKPPTKPTTPKPTTVRVTTPRPTTPRPTTPRPTTPRPTTPRPTTPRPTTFRPRPQPDISSDAAQSPSVQIRPDPPAEKKENCGHSFHSFLCEPSKPSARRRIYNGRKPDVAPQSTNFIGQNSFLKPERLNPPPPPPPPPSQPPKPSGGSLLLGANSFPQSTQVRPGANTYLPPPPPTPTYRPPTPKGPPNNINFFGDESFLDPEKLRAPTQKPPPLQTTSTPFRQPPVTRPHPPPPTRPPPPPTRPPPPPPTRPPPPSPTRPPPPPTTRPPPPPTRPPTRPTPPPTRQPPPPPTRPRPDNAPSPAQNTNVVKRPEKAPSSIDNHSFHSFLYQKPKSGGRRVYNGQRQTSRTKRFATVLGDITNSQSPRVLRRLTRQAPIPEAGDDNHHHHDDHHGDHHGDHHHGDHHGDHHHHHRHNITLEELCRDPFHAFLCDPVDTSRRQLYDGERYTPDKRGRIKGRIFGAHSILNVQKVRPEQNSLNSGVANQKDTPITNSPTQFKLQPLSQPAASFKTVQPQIVRTTIPQQPSPSPNPSPSPSPRPNPTFVTPPVNVYTGQPIVVEPETQPPISIERQQTNVPQQPFKVAALSRDFDSPQNLRFALLKEKIEDPNEDQLHHKIAEIIENTEPRHQTGDDVYLQPIQVQRPAGERRRRPKVIEGNTDGEAQYRQRQQRRRRPKPRPFTHPSADLEGRQDTTHTPIHKNEYFDSLHDWQGIPNQRRFGQKVRQRRLPEEDSPEVEVAITPVSPAVFARGPRGITSTHLASNDRCVFTFQGYQCRGNEEGGARTKREEKRVFTGQGRAPVEEDDEEEKKEKKETKHRAPVHEDDEEEKKERKETKHTRDDQLRTREEQLAAREAALARREEELDKREEALLKRLAAAEENNGSTTEDPLVKYQREVDEDLKRRAEEQKLRDEELERRKEEAKNRDEELERRKAQEVEVKKELERRKVQQKQSLEELERRKEERVRVKLEEERRKKIKELDEE